MKIKITGDDHVIKAFASAAALAQDLTPMFRRIGAQVEAKARQFVPMKTGRLKATIGYTVKPYKVVISAGGPPAVDSKGYSYGPVVHYGDPHRNYPANPFLTTALALSGNSISAEFEKTITELLKKAQLK